MHTLVLAGLAYGLMSLFTFAAYVIDKSAARRGARRVRERTLHLLALLGGWPGALLAQRVLRHKTVKPIFRLVFWFTVLGNIAVACLALTWGMRSP